MLWKNVKCKYICKCYDNFYDFKLVVKYRMLLFMIGFVGCERFGLIKVVIICNYKWFEV